VWCLWDDQPLPGFTLFTPDAEIPETNQRPLYQPIEDPRPEQEEDDEEEAVIDPLSWRATAQDAELPGKVLGKLVHKALHRWCFPGDPHLDELLEKAGFAGRPGQ
jgi:hypothetical protein